MAIACCDGSSVLGLGDPSEGSGASGGFGEGGLASTDDIGIAGDHGVKRGVVIVVVAVGVVEAMSISALFPCVFVLVPFGRLYVFGIGASEWSRRNDSVTSLNSVIFSARSMVSSSGPYPSHLTW